MDTVTAAKAAKVTVATVRAWCRRNVVSAVKAGGRWVIDAASLARRIELGVICGGPKATVAALFADKPHLVAKATELIELGGVTLLRGRVCRTVGSNGDRYLTAPESCNCKAGLKARHVCHHRIAALLFLATRAA
jgi:hypothetical protein